VHPLEEAQGFRALLNLDEPKYSIEQISAKTGKSPAYVAARLRLTELVPAVVEAFYKDEIGVGHALLLAKLQPAQQEEALPHCFREDWGGTGKNRRILLPVRNLQQWIEQNVMLILKDAPFSTRDAQLVPAAGSCADCPKRTGQNKLLFSDLGKMDACSDPACYAAKLDAHVKQTIAAKPKLVQITTAYGKPIEGSAILTRSQYVEIRQEKPQNKYQQAAPEYRPCKHATEAIIAEGTDKGKLRKVCADPNCPIHHPKQKTSREDEKAKAEQEKQRKEQAIANATGLRVLSAVSAAVPVRLMKRDLLFILEKLVALMDLGQFAPPDGQVSVIICLTYLFRHTIVAPMKKKSQYRDLFPGAMELMILKTLSWTPMHGYALTQRLKDISEDYLLIEEGSLYPALQRMLKNGWLETEMGLSARSRPVRIFKVTEAGRKHLEQELASVGKMFAGFNRVLALAGQ
jgi:transcriptional regulator